MEIINTKIIKEDEIYSFTCGDIHETLDISKFDWFEKVDACEACGYLADHVSEWIDEGAHTDIILLNIFKVNNNLLE